MFKNLHKTGELFTIFEKSYCHVGTISHMKGLKAFISTAKKTQCFDSPWHNIARFQKDSVIQMLEKFLFK